MENTLMIATALNDHVRIYLADTTNMVEKEREFHHMWPTSLAALGRVMSVTAVMGSMQKEENESVTVTINGGGAIGTILATADSAGNVKGFCGDNEIYLKYNDSNKLAVGLAVGNNGYLKVTRDLKLKQNYTSQVALQTGEIGDDFAYYFSVSEQVNTLVSVGVLVDTDYSCKAAGVMIIELLPNHTEEDIVYVEDLAKDLQPISSVISTGTNLHEYLRTLFPDSRILEEKEIRCNCDCSKDRFLRNLLTLPKEDIEELAKDETIEVKCEFCEKTYTFDKEDLNKLLKYVSYRRD